MTYVSILGLLLAAAAPVAPQRPSLPVEGPAAMDVAGITLGMTPAAVRAAMAASGYRVTGSDRTLSFEQNVQVAVATATGVGDRFRTDGASPKYIEAVGPHGEQLRADFAQWPAGPVVVDATLKIDMARQSQADFVQQVRAKFGKPDIQLSAGEYQWCTPGEKRCGPMQNPEMPTVRAISYMNNQLQLLSGAGNDERLRQAIKAEVGRRVPQHRQSSF